MHGVEVWNASAHRENDRGDSAYVWDRQLDEGAELAPFATDDTHYGATDLGDGSWEAGIGLSTGERARFDDGEILERDDAGAITRARFTPSPDEWPAKRDRRWWRLVVEDAAGKRAWSPIV